MAREVPRPKRTHNSDVRAVPAHTGVVLVAMPRADELNFIAFALRRRGHHVECTESATEAERLLRVHRFDVLVADETLADANLHSLARAARAQGAAGILVLGDRELPDPPTRAARANLSEQRFKRPMPIVALVRCVEAFLSRDDPPAPDDGA